MCVVKRVMLLLLLAAIGTNAVPGPEDCDGLNITLPTTDLHKILGHWVLVWSVSDKEQSSDVLSKLSSSHVELELLPDNNTVVFKESNMLLNKSCIKYSINMSMHSDPSNSDHHSLHVDAAMVDKDGEVSLYNESGEMLLFESCSDCLVMVYKETEGRFLLIYRREGQHQDVEQMKADRSDHEKLAECLGLPHDKAFIYDGAADFCQKKSSPVVTPEQS